MLLYEPDRHERRRGADWTDARACAAIERIASDAHRGFSAERLWPIHPFDVAAERPAAQKPLYFGAAGVIWALDELFRRGAAASGPQYLPAVRDLVSRHQADLQANPQLNEYMGRERASYLIGVAGMLMLQWKLEPTPELVERIHALLREKLGDARGLLWGAAGSMVAAVLLHERTGDSRWSSVFTEHFAALWDRWTWADELGCWVWVDELYGVKEARLGALHGFVANAYAIARGSHLLPAARRDEALARIAQTLQRTALTGSDGANWPHDVGVSTRTEPMPLLVQFCSGGPGVVACMANRLPALDALWLQAGELTWRAGPTTKFPVLCHGAVGAGYALLKLFERTGDDVWLMRARAFAMHGVDAAQRAAERYGQRKYSLWTGDLGLAIYLSDCLRGAARLPTLDVF
jgi:hypothetical protein